VIVDRLELEFRPGFTALTGETGAGKSILIDALSLALGDRAGSEQVRSGAERADVTAEFAIEALPELGRWVGEQALEGDPNRLLLRRVVDRNGRSRGFINGHAATVNQLREAGERLVDIHGQHAHQSLLKPEAQRLVLDAHAGLLPLAREAGDAHREWQRLCRARLDHQHNAAARNAEREQLSWQVEELSQLGLQPGEWETINRNTAASRTRRASSKECVTRSTCFRVRERRARRPVGCAFAFVRSLNTMPRCARTISCSNRARRSCAKVRVRCATTPTASSSIRLSCARSSNG
jgi:DNA repair protein RecN (Recombination protein N)